MPVLGKLRPETKKTTIDFGYGPIVITYKPRQIVDTAEDEERRQEEATAAGKNYLATEICRIVTEWDLTGPVPIEDIPGHAKGSAFDGGEQDVIPLDPDVVRFIDTPFLTHLVSAIFEDAQPEDPTKRRRELRKHGATPTSMKANGSTDISSLSPVGSTTS
jgi:hypothetical protein